MKNVYVLLCSLLLAIFSVNACAEDNPADFFGFRLGMTRADTDAVAASRGWSTTATGLYKGKVPGVTDKTFNVTFAKGKLEQVYLVEFAHLTKNEGLGLSPQGIYAEEKVLVNDFNKKYGSKAPNYKSTTEDGDRFHTWKLPAGDIVTMKVFEGGLHLEVEYSKNARALR